MREVSRSSKGGGEEWCVVSDISSKETQPSSSVIKNRSKSGDGGGESSSSSVMVPRSFMADQEYTEIGDHRNYFRNQKKLKFQTTKERTSLLQCMHRF